MSVSWKTRQVLRLTNDLIEAARAKALAEVLVAKAQGEAQAAKAEVQAAKAEAQAAKAETQIVKAQGEAQAAKAETQIAKAQTQIAKARGEAKDLLHSLQWRTVALAQLRGKLNMRGLLEILEEEMETMNPELKGRNRTETFKNALEHGLHYRSLFHCIQTQSNVKDATKASEFLSMIYASLSRKIHNSKSAIEYQVSNDQVDIDVHALSLQEARALECVAKHLNMPYRVVHEPGVDSSVDQ